MLFRSKYLTKEKQVQTELRTTAKLRQEEIGTNDYSTLLMKAVKVLEKGGSLEQAKAAVSR